jgi:hypothetical protein
MMVRRNEMSRIDPILARAISAGFAAFLITAMILYSAKSFILALDNEAALELHNSATAQIARR